MSEPSLRRKKWDRRSSTPSINPKKLMDLALDYCAKRETSKKRLQTYLSRKINLEIQPEGKEWIQEILLNFEKNNIINHERYAGMLNREYARRGKGKRYIQQKLKERGLEDQLPGLKFQQDDELERAIQEALKAIKKTRFKKLSDPRELRQKLLFKLTSLGFEYEIAKKAVNSALKTDSI